MQNMKMQCNVISESFAHDVKNFVLRFYMYLSEKNAPQPDEKKMPFSLHRLNIPMKNMLWQRYPGGLRCASYNLQYGTNYIAVILNKPLWPQMIISIWRTAILCLQ